MRTNINILTTRYKIEVGHFKGCFEIDPEGRMTFFSAPNSREVKEYHFEGSDPVVVRAIAKLLGQAANYAEKQTKGEQKSPALLSKRASQQGSDKKIAKKVAGKGSSKKK